MHGALFLTKEVQELEYLVKKELKELLLDIEDSRLNQVVRRAMEERYQLLFRILKRFSSPNDCLKYLRPKRKSI
jgi:hypothetical protein